MGVLFPKTINYIQVTFTVDKGKGEKSETASTFIGDVQPVTGKDLQALPELQTDVGLIKVYSNSQLNVSEQGTSNSGDIVLWQGKRWELVKELPYQNDLIEHFKYIGELREQE